MDLVDSLFSSSFVHPLGCLKFLSKLGFDVGDDSVAKLLGFGREGFLDKKSAQNPAYTIIDMTNTLSPSLRRRIWVL